MISTWLKKRRIAKLSNSFARRLRAGEIAAALALYETDLAPFLAELDTHLRATYHLQRWIALKKQEDFEALQVLGVGGGTLARASHTVEQMNREILLARAISSCDPSRAVPWTSYTDDSLSAALEKLGRALLESYTVNQRDAAASARPAAEKILAMLPTPESLRSESKLIALRMHLLVWAASILNDYELIWKNRTKLSVLGHEQAVRAQLAAAFDQSIAILSNRPDAATAILKEVSETAGRDVERRMRLAVSLIVLSKGRSEAVSRWLSDLYRERSASERGEWSLALPLALAIAYLIGRKYSQARQVLQEISQTSALVSGSDEEVRAQSLYLTALSFLANTQDWHTPSKSKDADANRDTVVQNRALWNSLQPKMATLVQQLSRLPDSLAWKGHLLRGLIAYVDSNATLDSSYMQQFSSAIELIESKPARTQLKRIEGTLISRAQATSEAVKLIKNKDTKRLKELNDTVLSSLGDAIPSLVRAAVYLRIWQEYPAYDPLPDLKRIPVQPSDEALINQCIIHVQAVQTLKSLSEETLNLDVSKALPSLTPLTALDTRAAQLGALAVATIQIRRDELSVANDLLQELNSEDYKELEDFLKFHIAWLQGNSAEARRILSLSKPTEPLAKYSYFAEDCLTRQVLQTLSANQNDEAWTLFLDLAGNPNGVRFQTILLSLVLWLIRRGQSQVAFNLLQTVNRRVMLSSPNLAPSLHELKFNVLLLQSFTTAQLGQYTMCVETLQELLHIPLVELPAGHKSGLDWARLLKIEAELCLAAQASSDVAVRWRSVQRTIENETPDLERNALIRPYLYLISGLLSSLSSDTLVDDKTVEKLLEARQHLEVQSGGEFLERVTSQLTWRKGLIEAFWHSLRNGEFERSRAIYLKELQSAFGRRVPSAIQLGAILAEIGTQTGIPGELLQRLDALQYDAPELDHELIAKIRNYLDDSSRILKIVELLNVQRFDEVIYLIHTTQWYGHRPGAMPLPVAVALLYAYYQKKDIDAALYMGEQISNSYSMPDWVSDYGSLILAYILFEKQRYMPREVEGEEEGQVYDPWSQLNAKSVLERIGTSKILKHDIDRYWAAAHFNEGIKLLGTSEMDKAFESFARSYSILHHQETEESLLSLGDASALIRSEQRLPVSALFFHIGVKSLKEGNRQRAIQAFSLATDSLQGLEDSREVVYYKLVAAFGERFSNHYFSEARTKSKGNRFGLLFTELLEMYDLTQLPYEQEFELKKVFRLTGICYELDKAFRLSKDKAKGRNLYGPLMKEVETIERLDEDAKAESLNLQESDPRKAAELLLISNYHSKTLLVLKGAAELLLSPKPNTSKALGWIEDAMKLGIDSRKLTDLLNSRRESLRQIMERGQSVLDRFDLYLANGSIPREIRNRLTRDDDLAELYRLNRNYTADEILAEDTMAGTEILRSRLNGLVEFVESDEKLKGDVKLAGLAKKLKDMSGTLKNTEVELLDVEKEIMQSLAEKLRSETLEVA